jgi:RNA polymerase sigma factor (sigma-70 family)
MEASALTHASRYRLLGRRSPLLRLQGDDRLVVLIRAHHDRAFEVLFDRYQPRLLAFCRGMLGSTEDAEDVLQDVFVAAHTAMVADSRPINVRPWLYRIARNRCLNHLRRPVPEGTDSIDAHPDGNGSTVERVQRREELRAIFADVAELPETQRTALVLREIDDLSYEEIAEAMGTTLAAVKSLLVRARMSLAEASEARVLDCSDVRLELAEAAEGLRKLDGATRQHVRKCERCGRYRSELRSSTRALAGLAPLFSLWALKKLIAAKIFGSGSGAAGSAGAGSSAGAGAGAAGSAGAGATAGSTAGVGATASAGATAGATAAAGVGTSGVAAAGSAAGGLAGGGIAGGGIAGGAVGAVGAKAATVATAALITAGAVGVQHYASPSPTNSSPAPAKTTSARPPATTYHHSSGGASAAHPKPSHPAPKPKPPAAIDQAPAATTSQPPADTSTTPTATTPTTEAPTTTTPSDEGAATPADGGATATAVEGQGGTNDPTATGDSVPVEPTYSNGNKPPKPAPEPTPAPAPPSDPVPAPEPTVTPPADPASPTDPPPGDTADGTTTTTTTTTP